MLKVQPSQKVEKTLSNSNISTRKPSRHPQPKLLLEMSLQIDRLKSLFSRMKAKTSAFKRTPYRPWTERVVEGPQTHQFIVGKENGFLPRASPMERLPNEFLELELLMQQMPLNTPNGKGLLAEGKFGETVEKKLPTYNVSGITDSALLMALFRDYTFAASAFLLEPCDIQYKKSGEMGLGRNYLPECIAKPLVEISHKIGAKPYMEYAQSYALYNYAKKDPRGPFSYDNTRLIRQFSGLQSESGFILVHVDMVSNTGLLVQNVANALDAVAENNRDAFDGSFANLIKTMEKINCCMEKMWKESSPADYMKFRTFILGTKNQDKIFPHGVVYKGTKDKTPKFFRGESGANDSIIPTIDNFLELTGKMPKNEMTDILKDFRTYRPKDHSRWLQWVEESAKSLSVASYAEGTPKSLKNYILLLDQVRDFRARHWNFAKEYIIRRTAYPVATGGSPMATWLPNQLSTVLQILAEKCAIYEAMPQNNLELPAGFSADVQAAQTRLANEVEKIKNRGQNAPV